MNRLTTLLLLSVFLIISCKSDTKSESTELTQLQKQTFYDFNEIDYLEDYQKVSDTSFVRNSTEMSHRVTQFRDGENTIIIFSKIKLDNRNREDLSILDTLNFHHQNAIFTIGYCDYKNSLPEEIIALVEKTDQDTVQKIIKAWKANTESNKIEELVDLEKIICMNES